MIETATPETMGGAKDARMRVRLLFAVAALGAIVLVGLILTMSEANRQRDRALVLQTHSSQVTLLARTLSATTARAEASLGRYVISADNRLGVRYSDLWRRAGDQIDQLDKVTYADSPEQRDRIDALRRAYRQRSAELSLIALSTRYKKNDQALARYYQARESKPLLEINALLDDIIDAERALLTDRTNEALQSVKRSTDAALVLVAFGVMIVLGAIALGWTTVQALGQRGQARAEADSERERAFELERAVAQATAELKQQAIERIATEGKLRQVQKMEVVGQLTGGIAHDFNNMLAVVLGGLELARRNIANPTAALRNIDNATEGANRAVALTRQLLAFSRADALQPAALDTGDLIQGMSDLFDRTLGDAIIVTTVDEGLDWRIWADRHQLENALLNLAVNARDAMEGRGTLTITTSGQRLAGGEIGNCPAGDYVTIAVTDTGCGMAPDVLERVFEPFFTTKPVGKGTGLGLSQIFGFVRQSDGEIVIRSETGSGTTVTLYLPRHTGEAVAQPADEAHAPPVSPTLHRLAILVVEDEPRVLAATIAALEALGHHPIGCGDPCDALDLIAANPGISLVISDVLMPNQTGPELVAQIVAKHPKMAVFFVTGFAGEADGSAEIGDHIVLRKPFTITALERAIATTMAAQSDVGQRRSAAA
ncbi:ATP-binding protein [Sphingomonas sp. 28-63-12]|uniref:ATP-binding protein n=1 Tax=Sphingomonas sp. 28-63-12 TaxID=1970434 RepID=UPI000BC73DF4|nr:MAG: kinase [Sphingomonas sp. 28-63-12]